METEANVDDLVDLWELLRDRGTPQTVEELCAGRPELAGELRRRIEALEAMDSALGTEAREPSSPTADRECRGASSEGEPPALLRATAVYRATTTRAGWGWCSPPARMSSTAPWP
jgi:hypothetical protein